MARDIPHIDLRDFQNDDLARRKAFVQTLGDGLKEFGFLTVEGHGIEKNTIQDAYKGFQDFFALDEETKKKYDSVAGGARGYTPFGREHAKDSEYPDLKEFWHVGQEVPEGHELKEWYPDNVWPEEIPALKDKALTLYRSLENCGEIILKALAEYFELPEDTFASMMKYGDSILRPIHYPPIPEGHPNSVRAAAHEDINLITLLVESHGSGLEVLTHEGNWLAIDALEGDIVVDSGDMFSRITNNVIPATTHRVINTPDAHLKSRYSMPFFIHPYATCDLSVKERFITDEQPAKFPPITARAFLEERLREIGLK
ncbi:MAG TPA: isopenicillin N synthase family oxygenase [Myxococcales bacterium]|nr:2OG-Fe(II) oxygenase [Deltaproteobacteria bacterium]HAA53909.1 isopenicillin N synthase family oxygenase [Myxococcales bacterium]